MDNTPNGNAIKVRKDLPEEPKVALIAKATGLDLHGVLGRLLRLWIWADSHAENDVAPFITCSWVDDMVCHKGFGQAMMDVGWLRQSEGGLLFPNLSRYSFFVVQPRRKGRCEGGPTDRPTPATVPPALDTTGFRSAWEAWFQYRAMRRQPMTLVTVQQQLKFLEPLGPDKAIEVVAQSIRSGWLGLFPIKGGPPGGLKGHMGPGRIPVPRGKYANLERVFPPDPEETTATPAPDAQTPTARPHPPCSEVGPPGGCPG